MPYYGKTIHTIMSYIQQTTMAAWSNLYYRWCITRVFCMLHGTYSNMCHFSAWCVSFFCYPMHHDALGNKKRNTSSWKFELNKTDWNVEIRNERVRFLSAHGLSELHVKILWRFSAKSIWKDVLNGVMQLYFGYIFIGTIKLYGIP